MSHQTNIYQKNSILCLQGKLEELEELTMEGLLKKKLQLQLPLKNSSMVEGKKVHQLIKMGHPKKVFLEEQ
jgi:hypothetical protein